MARDKGSILHSFEASFLGNSLKINVQDSQRSYARIMNIYLSPTANCQLMTASCGYVLVENFDKYQIRQSLINIRQNPYSKKILLFDLRVAFADKLTLSLPPSAIISRQDYVSTNGSNMSIVLVKLRSVVQFRKIPDPI